MTAMPNSPWPADTRYLQTGDLLVDLRYRRVAYPGGDVELPQRLFDLLLLLLAEPHTLHSRTELFQRLWPGVIVEDANLTQSMWLLRKALGDESKHWIRTVAKGGYVFEPPGPVEAFAQRPPSAGAPGAERPRPDVIGAEAIPDDDVGPDTALSTADIPAPRPNAQALGMESARPARSRSWKAWALAASLVAAIGLGVFWQRGEKPEALPSASLQPLSVVLIAVEDSNASTRWPAKLLHAWLGWKLGSLPEVTLLTEADFAVHRGSSAPQVVFLSSASAPGAAGQFALRARFHEAGKEQRLERTGPESQVPEMVDDLSRQLMARLLPNRAEPWPALTLDAPAARRYADAIDAIERRDSMTAAAALGEVVKLAPRFGLARIQLADAQARLAQASSAIEQMDAARELLQPAPAEVTEWLDAHRLAINPEADQQAVTAFAKLTARYPDKTTYALEYASRLVATGQPQQALKLLSTPGWDREPMGTRIARLIALTEVHHALGDPERMRQNARAAERLARDAGSGWELELGAAQLQAAIADTSQYKDRAGTQAYEQAAKQLELAGNHTLALYARFLAETAGPPASGPNPRTDALLVEARRGGHRSLEIQILANSAYQYYRVGDLVTYRRRLEEALVAAQAAGNTKARNQLTILLLVEDIAGARFDQADRRLQRLRALKFQGLSAVALGQLGASLDAFRGNYARSVRTLDRADRQLAALQPGSAPTEPQARLACVRAGSRLPLGDLAGARTDLKRCAASGNPATQLLAMLGRAHTELLAGDRAEAKTLLGRAQTILPTMPDGPERWEETLSAAMLLTRIGDPVESDRLYTRVLPLSRAIGYQWFVASAETGLAENAAARGDWAGSRAHAAAARRVLPADAWSLTYRLAIVDIAAALGSGDRARAVSLASEVHVAAHRLDDKVAQIEIHNLIPLGFIPDDCSQVRRDAVVASTGLRGATVDWMAGLRTDPMAKMTLDAKVR